MNAWKVRHAGSPSASNDLTFEQVMQGMLDGRFSPTDEVRGPNSNEWMPLEEHPAFEDAAMDVEEPQKPPEEEARLDMTALIDVCLVLLVFTILTTSYLQLQKIIEAAEAEENRKGGKPRPVSKTEFDNSMVYVKIDRVGEGRDARNVFYLGGKEISLERLGAELSNLAGSEKKYTLLLDHHRKVPHGDVVRVQDIAKSAKMQKVLLVVP